MLAEVVLNNFYLVALLSVHMQTFPFHRQLIMSLETLQRDVLAHR